MQTVLRPETAMKALLLCFYVHPAAKHTELVFNSTTLYQLFVCSSVGEMDHILLHKHLQFFFCWVTCTLQATQRNKYLYPPAV
jgi:hypothetical protein